jgi:hypothetical protein
MDVAHFKACITCTATVVRDQVPNLSSSNSFTYTLFIYSNTNPYLITFLMLILGTKVPQSLFCLVELRIRAIPVVHFRLAFSSVPFGVFTETVKLLFALLFPLCF